MSLREEMANIILLRYKECGVFDPKYDKEPLPVELEIADEIINKVLDAAMVELDDLDQIMIDIGEHANPPQQAAVMFSDVVDMLEALKEGGD